MAAVDITINGVLIHSDRSSEKVVLAGEAMIEEAKPPRPPLGIWPNPPEGTAPIPSHPIVLPGDPGWTPPDRPKPPDPTEPPIEWKVVWSPQVGWIVVGIPNFPHPAPSS